LTAAYELLQRTAVVPIILEQSGDIGGISKTVNYKGNRMDIGGHRFFSKSDRVMQWWLNIMPMEDPGTVTVRYQNRSRQVSNPAARFNGPPGDGAGQPRNGSGSPGKQGNSDLVMLVRRRISRIYFLRKFFRYPIQFSLDTLRKLGPYRTCGILISYTRARLLPRKERNLEDFFINRFGSLLYRLFFKDYTEKVWGVPCTRISAEWGAQRIKGISVQKAIAHALRSMGKSRHTIRAGKAGESGGGIAQKDTETSLIEHFLYPKWGPGQLWEEVARQVRERGGRILHYQEVQQVETDGENVLSIVARDTRTGETMRLEGEYFISTMPIRQLVAGLTPKAPPKIREVAAGLEYRDFITVGVLLKQLPLRLEDTWIYIQEKDVKVGRIQLFNNWSPFMVKDPDTVWLGMEYFCNKGEAFWDLPDKDILDQATGELEKMELARRADVLDGTVLRMEKTYPAYFGTYDRFPELQQYLDGYANLFLIGRNGMHKYNNSDHSMLTAMVAVDNIAAGVTDKADIWAINTEQEYHEEKASAKCRDAPAAAS
jgi:protoporphyrinogen oxidase